MRRHWRKTISRSSAVVLAVAVLVPAAGIAAATEASAFSGRLVGVWQRNVTKANFQKYGAAKYDFPSGVWTMVIRKNGNVKFYVPDSYVKGCTQCVPDVVTSVV